ncbi:hypothetical protein M422DRAFT_222108 [Sphaerobolus stellatus SS14]|nr:hypothetical protein M422DRAFT_222108 [Sphaerobolus stellatus SS14]
MHDLPVFREWLTITKWAEEYGDIVYTEAIGQPIIFLNSFSAARELMENKSSLYSDRNDSAIFDMVKWTNYFVAMNYGAKWKEQRRLFHQYFNAKSTDDYNHIQIKHRDILLRGFANSPDDFVEHIKHYSGSIVMEIVYGMQLKPKGDYFLEIAHEALSGISTVTTCWSQYVNVLPMLKYLPSWLPGMEWKRMAHKLQKPIVEVSQMPMRLVMEDIAAGRLNNSIMADALREKLKGGKLTPEDDILLRDSFGIAYLGGVGTVVSAETTFLIAMILYPEVQKRGQEELDTVLGDRLPTLEDRVSLPYINAICEEVLRWRPVVPIGLPHAVTQDDTYGEFFIPKGSIIHHNTWKILHDAENVGPRPGEFEPERHLTPGVVKPNLNMYWGMGRRICPGRFLAIKTLYLMVSSVLKTFNISHAKDSNGNIIPVNPDAYYSGTAFTILYSHPEPFGCSITLRSESTRHPLEE